MGNPPGYSLVLLKKHMDVKCKLVDTAANRKRVGESGPYYM